MSIDYNPKKWERQGILKDKLLIDVDWNDENLVRLSHYEPKYHNNPEVDKVLKKLVEMAKKEPQRFTKKQKKEFIERMMERLEDA